MTDDLEHDPVQTEDTPLHPGEGDSDPVRSQEHPVDEAEHHAEDSQPSADLDSANQDSGEAASDEQASDGREPEANLDGQERRPKREPVKKTPTPKPEAGVKPQKSATKAGKTKKRTHYNPGKTPPKPIELKDHSPWWIPWLGTSLIVGALILLVISYVVGNLPPFGGYWVFVCFGVMTLGLIVLSRWK